MDKLLEMKLEGELTIEVGGMETTVTLVQDQVATVETRDTDPVEEIRKAKK